MIDLWLFGTRLATIRGERSARLRLHWTDAGAQRWGYGSPILTVAQLVAPEPLTPGPTRAIIEGLLPEGDALTTLAARYGNHDELLLALGRETVGAVVAVPEGQPPPRYEPDEAVVTLTPADVAARLRGLVAAPLGVTRDERVRLSLAGAQPKLPLVATQHGYADPTYSRPSNVILKPEPGTWPRLVELEAWGLTMMRNAKVPTPGFAAVEYDGIPVLEIERYDRAGTGEQHHRRIHQEDMCMALGVTPDRKYAISGNDKTSLRRIADVIWNSTQRREDITDFVTTLLVNVAIGNCDAHARNTSLLHRPDGTVTLAPAYDIIPTYHYRGPDRKLAQPINRNVTRPESVNGSHLAAEFDSWGIPGTPSIYRAAYERMETAVAATPAPPDSPDLEALLSDAGRLAPPTTPQL